MKAAVGQIFSDFNKSPQNYKKETQLEKVKRIAKKPKIFVSIVAFLVVIVALSITLSLTLKQNDGEEETTTENPNTEETTSSSTETSKSTSPELSSTTPSSTPLPENQLKMLKKDDWVHLGLPLQGKYKQLKPIKKVIILNTKSDECFDEVQN
jgi:cytoskeletal protein RodZ